MYFIYNHHLAVAILRIVVAAPAKKYFSAFQLLEISQFCFLNAAMLKVMYLPSLTASVLPVFSLNSSSARPFFSIIQSFSYLSYI